MRANIFSTSAYFSKGKWGKSERKFGRHPALIGKIDYIILHILPMADEIPETPIKVKKYLNYLSLIPQFPKR